MDFTGMTDKQVIEAMAQQTGRICGRFRSEQLNRSLQASSSASYAQWRLLGVLTAGLLGLPAAQAQVNEQAGNKVEIASSPANTEVAVTSQSKLNETDPVAPVDTSKFIMGRVKAAVDSSYQPGVSIFIKNTTTGTVTDSLGYFKFALPADYTQDKVVLMVIQIGFVTQELNVKTVGENELSIVLQEDTTALGEIVVTGYYKKMSFLKRLRNRLIPKR